VEAGVDIMQVDDPALTYFCDRNLMARTMSACGESGIRSGKYPSRSINRVVEGLATAVPH
jgi:hypothetical protein